MERWKADEFPRILREAWCRGAHIAFLDESCFMLTPLVRRTLARRGQRVVLRCSAKHDRISAISWSSQAFASAAIPSSRRSWNSLHAQPSHERGNRALRDPSARTPPDIAWRVSCPVVHVRVPDGDFHRR